MVDDQDYLMNSTHRAYMPKLHQYIGDEGLHLQQFIATTSMCCPSRLSLLTGMFTHNHNVTANQPPHGGFPKFSQLRLDRSYLPAWLQSLNYSTYLTGKFLNSFDVQPGDVARCPQGFDVFDPLTEDSMYDYNNFDFLPQCGQMESFRDAYQTDVIRARALKYITDAAARKRPFYVQINPASCHTSSASKSSDDTFRGRNPKPAPRYVGRFANESVPRVANWGVPLPSVLGLADSMDARKADAAGGVDARKADAASSVDARKADAHYQARLETMLATDDMIKAVVVRLDQLGVLDNTYVVYVSDNGYHLGNHGLAKGKLMPYEEDVRVPFYMRGPGIRPGTTSDYMASMVDLTATIVEMAGGTLPSGVDGLPLPLARIAAGTAGPGAYPRFPSPSAPAASPSSRGLRDMLPLEMWLSEPGYPTDRLDYRAVRSCTSYAALHGGAPATTCWKYIVWCAPANNTTYRELFDLQRDPYEVNNLLLGSNASRPAIARLVTRLNAMLQVMGLCKGPACRDPWATLHPGGDVSSLDDAMDPQYDEQYSQYTRFAYRTCLDHNDPTGGNEVLDAGLAGNLSTCAATSPPAAGMPPTAAATPAGACLPPAANSTEGAARARGDER